MATTDQLKALMKSHAEGDDERFYAVALQVAARSARSGHSAMARELRDLVGALRAESASVATSRRPTPVAQPRGELAGLLTVTYPKTLLVDLSLDLRLHERLYRVIQEQRQRDALSAHGFNPQRRLLLVGPPGTGKTMTARALAGELRLPLFSIRLDSLITKMMGQTAAQLRLIFDAVAQTRGVYLFDEVDALAGERAHGNDVGEMRRVLNSFLQFLEEDPSDSLLVAASNHPQLMDRALFRRFESIITYPLPSPEVAEQVICTRLAALPISAIDWQQVREASRGHSHAELTSAAEAAARTAILTGSRITTEGICTALRDRSTDMD